MPPTEHKTQTQDTVLKIYWAPYNPLHTLRLVCLVLNHRRGANLQDLMILRLLLLFSLLTSLIDAVSGATGPGCLTTIVGVDTAVSTNSTLISMPCTSSNPLCFGNLILPSFRHISAARRRISDLDDQQMTVVMSCTMGGLVPSTIAKYSVSALTPGAFVEIYLATNVSNMTLMHRCDNGVCQDIRPPASVTRLSGATSVLFVRISFPANSQHLFELSFADLSVSTTPRQIRDAELTTGPYIDIIRFQPQVTDTEVAALNQLSDLAVSRNLQITHRWPFTSSFDRIYTCAAADDEFGYPMKLVSKFFLGLRAF